MVVKWGATRRGHRMTDNQNNDTLPPGFIIPLALRNGTFPWRVWACQLIALDEEHRQTALDKYGPIERINLDAEISYLELESRRLGVHLLPLARALKEIAYDNAQRPLR